MLIEGKVSQEAGQVVWYSHLFKNFPEFVLIHTVKGLGKVNKTEIDVFLEFSCFFYDSTDVGSLISGTSDFSKSSLNIWKFTVHILLKPDLENCSMSDSNCCFLTCTTAQLHSFHMLARYCSKSFKLGFNSLWPENFQMLKLDLENAGESF